MFFMTSVKVVGNEFSDCRCWGYLEKLKDAMAEIHNDNELNGDVMHEGDFNYLVIESREVGLCRQAETEWWYHWKEGMGWIATNKPSELKRIINFGNRYLFVVERV